MEIKLLYPKGNGFADPQETAGTPAGQLGPAIGLQVEGTAKEWQDLVSVLERKAPGLSLPVTEFALLRSYLFRDTCPCWCSQDLVTTGKTYYNKVLYGQRLAGDPFTLDLSQIKEQVTNCRYYFATRYLCRIVF